MWAGVDSLRDVGDVTVVDVVDVVLAAWLWRVMLFLIGVRNALV